MKRFEQYVESIVDQLPVSDEEKADVREEMSQHLLEHFDELMMQGYVKDEAITAVLAAFGHEKTIQKEMKKVLFPYYKFMRFFASAVAVAILLCTTSHLLMAYYIPQNDPAISVELFIMAVAICIVFLGVAEILYEAVSKEFRLKWLGPWMFFLVSAVLLEMVFLIDHFLKMEPGELWIFNDLLTMPLYLVFYVICRQLFTVLFVRKQRRKTKSV